MTYTEEDKRKALEWADMRDRPGEFPCADTEPLKVLAHFLRLAESDLADLKGLWEEPMKCGHLGGNSQPSDEGPEVCIVCHELSALRAERDKTESDARSMIALKDEAYAALRAENEALKQNKSILKTVDEVEPGATKYVEAVLIAVDRAEKAEKRAQEYAGYINVSGHGLIERAEAAEAKLAEAIDGDRRWQEVVRRLEVRIARLAEALKQVPCVWHPNTDLCRDGQTCFRCLALRETEGGAK